MGYYMDIEWLWSFIIKIILLLLAFPSLGKGIVYFFKPFSTGLLIGILLFNAVDDRF